MAKDVELVLVFVTGDLGRYLFAKSLLDRDAIEYMVKGDMIRMAHGWTPTGWTDSVLEPIEFWVRSEDVERARSLLRDLAENTGGDVRDPDSDTEQP